MQAPANVAITKTQNCQLISADTAQCDYTVTAQDTGETQFLGQGGVLEDALSVAPATLSLPDGVTQTANGFQINFTPVPVAGGGPQSSSLSFSATFQVPQGGLVVENCAALTFPGAGNGAEQTPAATSVAITAGPTCQANNDGTQNCLFEVLFQNQSNAEAQASFSFTTAQPNDSIGGPSGTGLTTIDNQTTLVEGPSIGPGESKSATLNVTFPAGTQDTSASVALRRRCRAGRRAEWTRRGERGCGDRCRPCRQHLLHQMGFKRS